MVKIMPSSPETRPRSVIDIVESAVVFELAPVEFSFCTYKPGTKVAAYLSVCMRMTAIAPLAQPPNGFLLDWGGAHQMKLWLASKLLADRRSLRKASFYVRDKSGSLTITNKGDRFEFAMQTSNYPPITGHLELAHITQLTAWLVKEVPESGAFHMDGSA